MNTKTLNYHLPNTKLTCVSPFSDNLTAQAIYSRQYNPKANSTIQPSQNKAYLQLSCLTKFWKIDPGRAPICHMLALACNMKWGRPRRFTIIREFIIVLR